MSPPDPARADAERLIAGVLPQTVGDVRVEGEDARLDPDGLRVLLRVSSPRMSAEMDVLLVPTHALEEPGRVRAYLTGWAAALPTLIGEQGEFLAIEELVCPLALEDDRLCRSQDFRDAMVSAEGPMSQWRAWVWGEAEAAEEAAEVDYAVWRAERWPAPEELPLEAAAAALQGRQQLSELQAELGDTPKFPRSLAVFLGFLRHIPEDARPAWELLGLSPVGLLRGDQRRADDEPPEFYAVLASTPTASAGPAGTTPEVRLGLIWDHPAYGSSGVGTIRRGEGAGRWWAGRTLLDATRAMLTQLPIEDAFDPIEAARQRRLLTEWIDSLSLPDAAARALDEAEAPEPVDVRWRRPGGIAGFGVLAPGETAPPTSAASNADRLDVARAALDRGEPALALSWGRDRLVSGEVSDAELQLLHDAYLRLGRDALARRLPRIRGG